MLVKPTPYHLRYGLTVSHVYNRYINVRWGGSRWHVGFIPTWTTYPRHNTSRLKRIFYESLPINSSIAQSNFWWRPKCICHSCFLKTTELRTDLVNPILVSWLVSIVSWMYVSSLMPYHTTGIRTEAIWAKIVVTLSSFIHLHHHLRGIHCSKEHLFQWQTVLSNCSLVCLGGIWNNKRSIHRKQSIISSYLDITTSFLLEAIFYRFVFNLVKEAS